MTGGTAELQDSGARPKLDHIEVVVNPASGGVSADAPAQLERILADAGRPAHIVAAGPDNLEACLKSALEARPDLLILLAGDGTARAAAQMAGPKGPLLAPLAGGTMNMLPFALYGRRPWSEALPDMLENGVVKDIGGGVIGEHHFYVAAILGAPALWAQAREAVRMGHLHEAFKRAKFAYSRAFSQKIRFSLEDGTRQSAEALTLLCPLVSRAMSEDEDALEADALDPAGAAEAFRLGFRALLSEFYGDWRDDPAVTARKTRAARAWASSQIPAIFDGEPQRLPKEVQIRWERCAFRALTAYPQPKDEPDGEAAEGASA
jgi:diacylglycerol kinase family enzyme